MGLFIVWNAEVISCRFPSLSRHFRQMRHSQKDDNLLNKETALRNTVSSAVGKSYVCAWSICSFCRLHAQLMIYRKKKCIFTLLLLRWQKNSVFLVRAVFQKVIDLTTLTTRLQNYDIQLETVVFECVTIGIWKAYCMIINCSSPSNFYSIRTLYQCSIQI